MGIYSRWIFPYLLDGVMADPAFGQYRHQVLADVSGEVLEIGFGTGLNLAYYPETVTRLTTIDPNRGMNALAQRRIQASNRVVDHHVLTSEQLPIADASFDWVVSTWTLCSIAQIDQALQEIHRVLKPGGKFAFIEHGLSDDPTLQRWQHRLTPLQKVIADGCHLDRNIHQLVQAVFPDVSVRTFYAPHMPKIGGYLYQGVAIKPNS